VKGFDKQDPNRRGDTNFISRKDVAARGGGEGEILSKKRIDREKELTII